MPNAKRAECAVRAGVAVAADDRHARLGQSEFWADDVHDALVCGVDVEERNAELLAVFLQRFDLLSGNGVRDRRAARFGGNVVIDRRHGAQRLPDFPAGRAQAIEGLG